MTRVIILLYRTLDVATAIAIMEALAAIANEPIARVPFIISIVLVMARARSSAAISFRALPPG